MCHLSLVERLSSSQRFSFNIFDLLSTPHTLFTSDGGAQSYESGRQVSTSCIKLLVGVVSLSAFRSITSGADQSPLFGVERCLHASRRFEMY